MSGGTLTRIMWKRSRVFAAKPGKLELLPWVVRGLFRRGFRAKPDRIWRIAARGRDIGPAVPVEVADCDSVDVALSIAPGDLPKIDTGSIIEENRAGRLDVSNDNICLCIAIEIRDRDRIRNPCFRSDHDRLAEFAFALVQINEGSLA